MCWCTQRSETNFGTALCFKHILDVHSRAREVISQAVSANELALASPSPGGARFPRSPPLQANCNHSCSLAAKRRQARVDTRAAAEQKRTVQNIVSVQKFRNFGYTRDWCDVRVSKPTYYVCLSSSCVVHHFSKKGCQCGHMST